MDRTVLEEKLYPTTRNIHDDDFLYETLKNRDKRFDGRFFFAVTSTGIYCRPICPARRPKRENCLFFDTAAAAENANFRPCLRCRPELAPENALLETERLVHLAIKALQCMEGEREGGLSALARKLEVSDRHLRRVFMACLGVSPVQYAQTYRLLFARGLVLDTDLSFADVAMASGFGSVRRMNALFRERYRASPTDLRKKSLKKDALLSIRLPYNPPYAWVELLTFLRARAIEGVEEVTESVYRRTVFLSSEGKSYKGWIEVADDAANSNLRVTLSPVLVPVLTRVVSRLKKLFDTDCRPEDVSSVLGSLTNTVPGLRVPGCFDPFEVAVRAVLGQQITVKAARTLATRLVAALGMDMEAPSPFASLSRVFPSPEAILGASDDMLGGMGIVKTRMKALRALAEFSLSGGLNPKADIKRQIEDLKKLPGIGDWTAQYIALRALEWPDAFPYSDFGLKAATGMKPDELLKYAEKWRPWRSYAALYLWTVSSQGG